MIDLNAKFDDNDPQWLVKVDTRVLGPFSFNEILSKLTTGELYSHNEVMAPLDRWRTLQSHPLFAAAVEKMRHQKKTSAEHTITRTERTSFTRTLDISFETMTPPPLSQSHSEMTITPPPQTTPSAPTSSAAKPALDWQVKPTIAPPVFRPQQGRSVAMPLMITAMGVIAAGFVIVMLLTNKSAKPKDMVQDSTKNAMLGLFDKGFYHKKRGEWSEALKYFRQAHGMNPKDPYTIFELAPLLIQFENQHIYARSILDKVIGTRTNPEDVCVNSNAVGLAYSYENLADKSSYRTAVKKFDTCLQQMDDEGVPSDTVSMVKLNKGFALMLLGEYGAAESVLLTSKTPKSQVMAPYLFLLQNYLRQGYFKNDKKAFVKAFDLSSQIIQRPFYDGYQEILLFHAYSAYKIGKDPSFVAKALENALNVDPDLTAEHYHSPAMDWRAFNWKFFDFICKDLKQFSRTDLVSWLDFTCSYKMNNEMQAQQVLGGWMNRSQDKDPALYVAQAILYYNYGEQDKARDALSLRMVKVPNKLYYEMLVKVCMRQNDVNCVKSTLNALEPSSKVHYLVAKIFLASKSEKPQWIQKGLMESKGYIPFIRGQ